MIPLVFLKNINRAIYDHNEMCSFFTQNKASFLNNKLLKNYFKKTQYFLNINYIDCMNEIVYFCYKIIVGPCLLINNKLLGTNIPRQTKRNLGKRSRITHYFTLVKRFCLHIRLLLLSIQIRTKCVQYKVKTDFDVFMIILIAALISYHYIKRTFIRIFI